MKKQIKRALKPYYFSAKRRLANSLHGYGPEALHESLAGFGISNGDTLLIHSGFSLFSGFTGSPEDVIQVARSLVGEDGNLMMMSMPYGGSSQRYADSNQIFDVCKTPSALGIISETFRRRPTVLRSANPLHPVLAEGPMAKWLVADHEFLNYSCGRRSPLARFEKLDGKVLFFDAAFRTFTFVHLIEHRSKDQLPVALYEPQPARITMRLANGKEVQSRQFLFSAEARERRNFETIENTLIANEKLKQIKVGNSRIIFTTVKDVVTTANELLTSSIGFYS